MKRTVVIAFAAAALCHALLFFGFRAGGVAQPFPVKEIPQTIDVALVEAAPEPAPIAAPDPAQEPAPDPAPTPAPEARVESPAPAETPPMPAPEPQPSVTPQKTAPRLKHPAKANAPIQPAPSPVPRRSLFSQWVHCWDSVTGTALQSARSNPMPSYPEEARRNGQQGVVLVSAQVAADGHPSRVTLLRSSGFPLLDAAALEAVRKWTFAPARAGGLPTASRVDVPVRFTLESR